MHKHFVMIGFLLAVAGLGCSSDDDADNTNGPSTNGDAGPDGSTGDADSGSGDAGGGMSAGPGDDCDVIIADEDCDTSLRPIVFIHGTFGSATEISNTAQLFGSNGYCQDRFVAVEYNSLGGSPATQLAELIDQVLADTGFDQVDLAGHSQGTGHACAYLSDPDNAAKVAHYLNISGGCNGNGVPTLSLSSQNDLRGGPVHSSGDNVEQVTLEMEDHVALSGSKESFIAMWKYLMGEDPEYTSVQCGESPITLDGKSVTFGDNVPRPGSMIEVFEIDELDSPRERGEPVMTIVTDEDGHFNAQLERNVRYEFRALNADGSLAGYLYYGPFKRSNYLMRFLGEADSALIRASSSDNIVRGPDHAALVVRYVAGALRKDWNNSLKIDGEEILTEENAGKSANVVGFFMYDANENGVTDLGTDFGPMSFLVGTDVFMDATEPRFMELEWTNEEGSTSVLKIPNWPSSDVRVSVVLPY